MPEQPVEKAQAHAKENRDRSSALDPNMAQSCLWLGPTGSGSEAATDQAEAPCTACSQTHRARPPGQPSTDGSGGREHVVWAVWFSVAFAHWQACPPPTPAVCGA